jgi:hypothetical protein
MNLNQVHTKSSENNLSIALASTRTKYRPLAANGVNGLGDAGGDICRRIGTRESRIRSRFRHVDARARFPLMTHDPGRWHIGRVIAPRSPLDIPGLRACWI